MKTHLTLVFLSGASLFYACSTNGQKDIKPSKPQPLANANARLAQKVKPSKSPYVIVFEKKCLKGQTLENYIDPNLIQYFSLSDLDNYVVDNPTACSKAEAVQSLALIAGCASSSKGDPGRAEFSPPSNITSTSLD